MFKILVVEDDRDLNRSVCTFLNNSGYEATGCLSADEAYDAMYDTVFDLIVSDIMMPGTDGYEFASSVRAINEAIPMLFMTARDDIASKQRSFRIGVDDYMVKPIDFDELFLRIGALLRRAKISASRKLERLRRLDRAAESKATAVSLVLGILGTLILGFGMSLVLSELSLIFESRVIAVTVGIILGIIGGAIVALAYPVYNRVLAKERERIAPEMIRLSDELMK